MSVQRSTIPRAGVAAVLAVCVALPVVTRVKNGPLEENPGHQVDEILGGNRYLKQHDSCLFQRWRNQVV